MSHGYSARQVLLQLIDLCLVSHSKISPDRTGVIKSRAPALPTQKEGERIWSNTRVPYSARQSDARHTVRASQMHGIKPHHCADMKINANLRPLQVNH